MKTTDLMLCALILIVVPLWGIEDQLTAVNLSTEEKALTIQQENLEQQSKAYMDKQDHEKRERLESMAWGEAKDSEEIIQKVFAHNLPLYLFGFIVILSGPALMRRHHEHR